MSAFDGWYGRLYDATVNARALAPLGGFLLWGADVERAYRLMARSIECEPGQLVVDVPTGGGVAFSAGAPATRGRLLGIDLSAQMLDRARRRREAVGVVDRVDLLRADATRLPLRDSTADRICCFTSIHCLPEAVHPALLTEFRRVLKPGGELVGTTLVRDGGGRWRASVRLARLSGFFTPPAAATLEGLARAAGFAVWEADRSGSFLYFRGK